MDHLAFPPAVRERAESFRERNRELTAPGYKEATARVEFIDPLLRALGWDVSNEAGLPERFRQVLVEPSQDVDGHKRAPDYAMRIGGNRKFFVEAKKPSVYIKASKEAAFQARRYAWSAQLPIVVLTNFREIAIYDGRVAPASTDSASKARILYLSLRDLEERWAELAGLVSKTAVESGSLERFVETRPRRRGTEAIDVMFLRHLEAARVALLRHIAEKNRSMTDDELLTAIQLTLDRIVFLRFCEDRSLEPWGALKLAVEAENPKERLEELYRRADARYNSGLFHFDLEDGRVAPDALTLSMEIDDEVLRQTVARFYPPESPYAFSLMPIEVLGRAYETFLSFQITRSGGVVNLEQKPEVRKAGGVYYTPEWLATAVVRMTLDPLLDAATLSSIQAPKTALRIVDPSCGSGSFLVQAYRYLLDWFLARYTEESSKWLTATRRVPARLIRTAEGELALSGFERKRILTDHVFGVDIDSQAVEVAKLSLLLAFLEDESATFSERALDVFKDRILPDIDRNVRVGNSLVGPDILSDDELGRGDEYAISSMRAFDWRSFGRKFSAVVGNPPWLMAGYEIPARQLDYLKSSYKSYEGKADLYYLFIERSLQILQPGGRLGLVVPNKMHATKAASALRKLLTAGNHVREIIDFESAKLFEGAVNYTQILLGSSATDDADADIVFSRANARLADIQSWAVPRSRLSESPWDLSSPAASSVWTRMASSSRRLDDLVGGFGNGVQSGKDSLLVLPKETATALKLEVDYLRPFLRGRNIRGGAVKPPTDVIVFPYREEGDTFRLIGEDELRRAPWLFAYLESHKEELRKRLWFGKTAEELSGHWWGLMYLDQPLAFSAPHLVTPSLSGSSNFALGDGSLFATGTAGVTSVELLDDEDTDSLLALLNSPLISAYIVAHSPVYQGNARKFSAGYLRGVPIKWGDDEDANRTRLGELWRARQGTQDPVVRSSMDARIGDVVLEIYGISATELDDIMDSLRPL
ncbi:Eco57I restriction-modification methylase domain-containing protein [Microbacterium testaceum]|uniref:Eco57I restriction-modification methylase domain-containing protein n=1 Tax=Microbacterium testaceum TaxID=2033 RepID=UPI000B20411E|nr:N-6 DNA methylase [Microbacterium testaceum]